MSPFLQVIYGDLSNDKLMGIYYACTSSRSQAVLDNSKVGYCVKCSCWRQVSSTGLKGEGCGRCDCKAGHTGQGEKVVRANGQ